MTHCYKKFLLATLSFFLVFATACTVDNDPAKPVVTPDDGSIIYGTSIKDGEFSTPAFYSFDAFGRLTNFTYATGSDTFIYKGIAEYTVTNRDTTDSIINSVTYPLLNGRLANLQTEFITYEFIYDSGQMINSISKNDTSGEEITSKKSYDSFGSLVRNIITNKRTGVIDTLTYTYSDKADNYRLSSIAYLNATAPLNYARLFSDTTGDIRRPTIDNDFALQLYEPIFGNTNVFFLEKISSSASQKTLTFTFASQPDGSLSASVRSNARSPFNTLDLPAFSVIPKE